MTEQTESTSNTADKWCWLQRRCAAYYIGLAAEAQREYRASVDSVLAGLQHFDQERGQLDAARVWLQGQPPDGTLDALLLADASATVDIGDLRYDTRGERIPQLRRALEAAQRQYDRAAQGAFLGNLGLACFALGETRKAVDCYEQVLSIAQETGDRHMEGDALGNLGVAYRSQGEARRTISVFEQVVSIAREIGDRHMEGAALGNLGLTYADLGEVRRAIGFYEQVMRIARETGDRRAEGATLGNLGLAYADLGEIRRAASLLEQHLTIAREIGDRHGEANALGNLGLAYADLGEGQQAAILFEQHLAIARETGDRPGEANAMGNLGNTYRKSGEANRAIGCYEQVLILMQEMGDRRGEGKVLGNLGLAYAALGQRSRAIDFYKRYLTIAREVGDRHGEAAALGNLGVAYEALDDVHRAVNFYKQALAVQQSLEDHQGVARTQWNLGGLLAKHGDVFVALPLLEQSLAVLQACAHPRAGQMATMIEHLRSRGTWLGHSPEPAFSSRVKNIYISPVPKNQKQSKASQLHASKTSRVAAGDQRAKVDAAVRTFLPLLGDIALGAHGDPVARALAEARLLWLEERGWHLTEAARSIWAGERKMAALTAGLDAQHSALVRRTLALVAGGPPMIVAAESLRIAHLRRQVDMAFAEVQRAGAEERAALAGQLSGYAEQAVQNPGAPWADLAAHLRDLARRLMVG